MSAAELIASKPNVLMDFDGPICSVFGGVTAQAVAVELQKRLGLTAEHSVDTTDPFDILRWAAADGEREVGEAERELTALEVDAVKSAPPTDGAADVLRSLRSSGHMLVIVSNNSTRAIETYLNAHSLRRLIHGISARENADAALLKPDPHLLLRALDQLQTAPENCVMVGDSTTDIEAAQVASVPVIAYANKPGKRASFERYAPESIVDNMSELLPTTLT